MRNYDRFIPGEEIDAVKRWNFGAIDTAAQLLAAQAKAREDQEGAAQLASTREQGFAEGYTQGIEQGRRQAQADLELQMQEFLATQARDAAARFQRLFESAQSELMEAEQAMAQGVLELASELARQVLHQELTVNTQVLMPVLREALELLGADCKTAVVKLNPADLIELGEQIHADFAGLALTLRADATVQQGGCVLESAGTVIDASLPKRWQQAVGRLGMSSAWRESHEPG